MMVLVPVQNDRVYRRRNFKIFAECGYSGREGSNGFFTGLG
jgi:hypothetical protein